VIIGGSFDQVNGQLRSGLARLLDTGEIEEPGAFDIGFGTNSEVFTIQVLSGNRIAVGGTFSAFNNQPRNGVTILNVLGGDSGSLALWAGDNNGFNSVRSLLEQDGKLLMGGWVRVREAGPRVMWLTEDKDEATVTFTQGKLSTAPVSNPIARFEISAKNVGVPKTGNTGAVKWTYNASTGIVSGQFSPDVAGVKRIAKYTALLVPVTPSDIRGMGSFDLPEVPSGLLITSKNSPIHTGKVVITPEP
jgi:hypothetical protein